MYAILDIINVCELLFLQKYGLYFTDIEPCLFFYYKCPYVYINKPHNLDFELEKSEKCLFEFEFTSRISSTLQKSVLWMSRKIGNPDF